MKRSLIFGLALTLALSAAAFGQEWRQGKGRLEGTVTNEKGEPVADAVVSLRLESIAKGPDLKTNKKGYWAILGLSGGMWDIDITAPGFQTKKLSVNVDETKRMPAVEAKLAPSQKQEEQLLVGGKKISKETAALIEQANKEWATGEDALKKLDACGTDPGATPESTKSCQEAARVERKTHLTAALSDYEKVMGELPENDALIARLEIGNYWVQNYDQALKYARQIAAKDPSNTTSWMMIAELELQKGNFDAGKEALTHVPDEKITDSTPYMNMGILYYNKSKPSDADEWFSKAIAKKADSADAYYYRGLARYQLKRLADAKADIEKSLELAPTGENAETAKEILKAIKQELASKAAPRKKPSKG